jgi:two-component system chemotaxis response regulator CheY
LLSDCWTTKFIQADAMTNRLLITDDALIIRQIIRDCAEAAGWEVAGEASDGAEAIALYERLRPTAVTLDMVMPVYDGLHALAGIMRCDPHAKVLVVSALNQKPTLREAFRLGAADFLVKPFDRHKLTHALAALLPEPAATA